VGKQGGSILEPGPVDFASQADQDLVKQQVDRPCC
jgi:hypothetical protein